MTESATADGGSLAYELSETAPLVLLALQANSRA